MPLSCCISELYNIDLDDVIRKTKGFIPTTVTNLYEFGRVLLFFLIYWWCADYYLLAIVMLQNDSKLQFQGRWHLFCARDGERRVPVSVS